MQMELEQQYASPPLGDVLGGLLGPGGVLTGTHVSSRSCDPLAAVPALASIIARPKDTSEVAAVMALCAKQKQSVVVHGGRTGVAGGAYTQERDLILSLERMSAIEEICTASQVAVVQAGVTIEALQNAAKEVGLFYPVDLGSKGSATVGGTIATNAGGNRVLRWGMTRQNVLGCEAVLADGTIVSCMGRLVKDNTGYDLKQSFIGSEGTLGVVTRAVVRLVPLPSTQSVAFVAVRDYENVVKLLAQARQLPTLSAFEVMWSDFYELMAASDSGRHPLESGYPFYVLIESLGYNEKTDADMFNALLEGAFESELIADAVVAVSDKQCEQLWHVREGSEIIVREMSPFLSFDISVEIPVVEQYINEVRATLHDRFPEARMVTFGHLGDNNIHIGVSLGGDTDEFRHDIETIVYNPLPRYGGSISAEHGIGQHKREFLQQQKSAGEMEAMRRVRQAFDPERLLNPEVLF